MRTLLRPLVAAAVALSLAAGAGCAMKPEVAASGATAKAAARGQLPTEAGLPARPEDLAFDELAFEPPNRMDYRHELSNGVPVYVVESHEFPLVQVDVYWMVNGELATEAERGARRLHGALLRKGGSTTRSPEEVDERLDFLAVNLSVGGSYASLNTLKSNLDESLTILADLLRNPGWDAERLRLEQAQRVEQLAQGNDDADDILRREFAAVFNGRDTHLGRPMTAAMVEGTTAEALESWHRKVVHPGNFVITVVGDTTAEEILPKLEQMLEGWEKGERIPRDDGGDYAPEPGLYRVEKDIPQGKFRLAVRAFPENHPDAYVAEVLDHILGSSGFTSRLMKRIRSDEGLTYGVWSRFVETTDAGPRVFMGSSFSKNRTVALTLKLMLEEFERIRTEPVSEAELANAKAALVEAYPQTFDSKASMAAIFADDEWDGRDPAYWAEWRAKIEAVTADDVLRVAKEYIDPEQLTVLLVGKWDEIAPGDLDGRATMAELFGGQSTELPLRDPLTDQPLDAAR